MHDSPVNISNPASILEWVVAGLTFIALLVAIWELRENVRVAGQAHAREAWMKYLELGIQYPQFGSTDDACEFHGIKNVTELYENGDQEAARYWWFLDIMMESMESLTNYFPEKEWKNTINYNISLHRKALELIWDKEVAFYSKKLSKIVEKSFSNWQVY